MSRPICFCTVVSPQPKSPCDINCIYAPNMLVAEQVTACAETTDIDISPIIVACKDNDPIYKIVSYKNVTGEPSITKDKITFTPENNNYEPGEISYKVSCGLLSAIGKIIIVYKNNCINVDCPTNHTCNKCTGDCNAMEIDLSVITEDTPDIENTSGFVI